MRNRVYIFQPIIPAYRIPVFNDMATQLTGRYELTVIAAKADKAFGFDASQLTFQPKLVDWKQILAFKWTSATLEVLSSKSKAVLHVADFTFLSLWLLLLFGRAYGIPVYLHGQGGYKRTGWKARLIYNCAVALCSRYICYTEFSRDCLSRKLFKPLRRKLSVVDNTLYLEPVAAIDPAPATTDLLYIGRLREGCGIELLLQAAGQAGVSVRVVGGGDESYLQYLQSRFPHARWYGILYSAQEISAVAAGCMAGAYGGDAGLSVVHYMALGLPVIVHDKLVCHMGPEPSYVQNEVNGLLFERDNPEDLSKKIGQLVQMPQLRNRLAQGALNTFNQLSHPSMGERFLQAMELRE